MTAFDAFQEATCEIGEGNRAVAFCLLTAAIKRIDRDGVDAFIRPDLVALRNAVAANMPLQGSAA